MLERYTVSVIAGLLKKRTMRNGRSVAEQIFLKIVAGLLEESLCCRGEAPLKIPLGTMVFCVVSGNAREISIKINAPYAIWNHCVARQFHR